MSSSGRRSKKTPNANRGKPNRKPKVYYASAQFAFARKAESRASSHASRLALIEIKVEKLVEGAQACISNARDFLIEAEMLMKNGHLRHSVGLLELGVEEMGKAAHILDAFEDATMSGEDTTWLVGGIFKRHLTKLAFTPMAWVPTRSCKDHTLRNHLRKFYSHGPNLREKSFYVDLDTSGALVGGRWLWGNPDLEKKETISFLLKGLRRDCQMLDGAMKNVLMARSMIERWGLHDKRTQEFLRNKFGMTTAQKLRQGRTIRLTTDPYELMRQKRAASTKNAHAQSVTDA
jgi:AbiV family abortive infection protein